MVVIKQKRNTNASCSSRSDVYTLTASSRVGITVDWLWRRELSRLRRDGSRSRNISGSPRASIGRRRATSIFRKLVFDIQRTPAVVAAGSTTSTAGLVEQMSEVLPTPWLRRTTTVAATDDGPNTMTTTTATLETAQRRPMLQMTIGAAGARLAVGDDGVAETAAALGASRKAVGEEKEADGNAEAVDDDTEVSDEVGLSALSHFLHIQNIHYRCGYDSCFTDGAISVMLSRLDNKL
jgi:hypothetical protein